MVAGQGLGQRGGGVVRLLGLLCIDDGDEKILELREKFLEHLGALPPWQAGREHLVGIGRDAEMAGRVPPGKNGQSDARQDYERALRRQKSTKPTSRAGNVITDRGGVARGGRRAAVSARTVDLAAAATVSRGSAAGR